MNESKPLVAITGATGHLGRALVSEFLENGYRVIAGARNLKALEDLAHPHLQPRYFNLDDFQSISSCLEGTSAVFHLASHNSPFSISTQSLDSTVINPIVVGTRQVGIAIKKLNIPYFYFSSSCSTLGIRNPPVGGFSEKNRNEKLRHPITQSKWRAEQELIRNFQSDFKGRLTVFHIPWLIGPGFFRVTSSTQPFVKWANGNFFPLPDMGCHFLDVRDAAKAHRLVFENDVREPTPQLTHLILAGEYLRTSQFMELLRKARPHWAKRLIKVPWPAIATFSALESIWSTFSRKTPQLGWSGFLDLYRCDQRLNLENLRQKVPFQFRTTHESLIDMLNWIENHLEALAESG